VDVDADLELATVEVLGALAYGQLRSFEAAAHAVRHAPDVVTADQLAELAVREHRAYEALRDHLAARTDLAAAVMDRQKPHFDAYFDRIPDDDWFCAGVFFAVGLPIAADFGRALAPTLAPETAVVVVGALADRAPFERFAMDQLGSLLVDDETRERARHVAADVLGRALTAFQGVIADTDALKVLLEHHASEEGVSGETRVKELAITVLEGHRRRLVALGLEDLDEL
jgi:hypothetical protein